jgi:protein-tyrosine-phosphatase
MAAAYFQRLAGQHQLDVNATFAGTEPDAAISPAVAELLRSEGIDVTGYAPHRVTAEELAQAWRVISLGCEVDHLASPKLAVERWDDVPPPSEDLAVAKNIILAHVEQLVAELKFLEPSNSL